jgi:hypothetical protein
MLNGLAWQDAKRSIAGEKKDGIFLGMLGHRILFSMAGHQAVQYSVSY